MNKNAKLKRTYKKKIDQLVEVIKELDPEKIILYGSVARNEIHSDSDIDLCVIKKTNDRLKVKREISDLIWEHNIGFDPEIDINVYSPSVYYDWLERNDPFIEEIEKGKVLYEKG